MIEKVPNLCDDIATNLLPFIVAYNGAGLLPDSGIVQQAGAMQSLVPSLISATDHVIATAGYLITRQDQTLQRLQVDRQLQTAA